MSGYIKLYRSVLDHDVFDDDTVWRVFCWCLLKANYKPSTYMGEEIPVGSFVTGRNTASDQLHLAPSKWWRAIEKLSSNKLCCISKKSNIKWTMITVCNYSTYQSSESETEQRSDNNRTAIEQQVGASKEGKKGRKKEEGTSNEVPSEVPASLSNPAFQLAWSEWCQHRKESGKKLTPLAIKKQLAKLAAMGPERSIEAIEHSIAQNYAGIFEPSVTRQKESPQPFKGPRLPTDEEIERGIYNPYAGTLELPQ